MAMKPEPRRLLAAAMAEHQAGRLAETELRLHAAGCQEFIAPDKETLIARAADASRLGALRAGQCERIARSAFCDAEGFGHAVGEALHGVWERRAEP